MAKLIYLSPSNHGVGANKCKKSGCYEDKHTRPIAEVCARHLKNNGFDVVIGKTTQNMAARCNESNSKKAALHVPIHTNAFSNGSARYLMFMFYEDNDTYREIFNAVAPHVEEVYPGKLKAKFAKRIDLYEINAPSAKTMYCELGFHTNQKDCDEFIHKPEVVGKALAKGICSYFGVTFKEEGSPESSASRPEASKPAETAKPKRTIASVYNANKGLTVAEAVKAGQAISNIILGTNIPEDGKHGPKTKANGVKILQWAMNMDYGAGLEVNGEVDSKTKSALGQHTVRYGETQYMVTALEVLLLMRGYNPHGVELPGEFGAGCQKATGQFQSGNGLTMDKIAGRNTFLGLVL